MPNVHDGLVSFTAGELSPLLAARVDIAAYRNGAKRLDNFLVRQHGAATRAWGTSYRGEVKTSAKKTRIIPYVASQADAYLIELGDLYLRVWKNGARLSSVELVTPYTEAQLFEIDFSQSADTMVLTHRSHAPRRLQRFSDTLWRVDPVPFIQEPCDEVGIQPGQVLTLAALTGSGINASWTSGRWQAADVGRYVVAGSGRARVVSITNPVVAVVDIEAAFTALAQPAYTWTIEGTPRAAITPSADGPVGTAITLTLDAEGWKDENIGGIVRVNGGAARVIARTDAVEVDAIVVRELSTTTAAPIDAWDILQSIWGPGRGYPATAAFHEQRLWFAGSPGAPQSVYGSQTGIYFDFTPGSLDTDAVSYRLASEEQNPVEYLAASGDALVVFGYGEETLLKGGVEKPITPTNIQRREVASFGCARVRPVRVQRERVMVQRSRRQVVSIRYESETGAIEHDDVGVLSEHLMASGIVDMAYQRRPLPLLWAVRADGAMAVATFDRKQNVLAWAPRSTEGLFESVATLPTPTGEECYVVVRRGSKRFIERMETSYEAVQGVDYGWQLDSAVTFSAVTATAAYSVPHLAGLTVQVLADGCYGGIFTVAGDGALEIDEPAYRTMVGLPYISALEPMPPEVALAGTSRARPMRVSELSLVLYRTIGGLVNERPVVNRALPVVTDAPPPMVTDDVQVTTDGMWQRGKPLVTVVQAEPFPMTVLGIVQKLTVNG